MLSAPTQAVRRLKTNLPQQPGFRETPQPVSRAGRNLKDLYAGLLFIVVRLGFLTLVVQFSTVSLLLGFPLTSNADTCYFSHGMFAVVWVVAMAMYGFQTALLGRASVGQLPTQGHRPDPRRRFVEQTIACAIWHKSGSRGANPDSTRQAAVACGE